VVLRRGIIVAMLKKLDARNLPPAYTYRVDHERETAAVETLLSRVRMGYILFLSFL